MRFQTCLSWPQRFKEFSNYKLYFYIATQLLSYSATASWSIQLSCMGFAGGGTLRNPLLRNPESARYCLSWLKSLAQHPWHFNVLHTSAWFPYMCIICKNSGKQTSEDCGAVSCHLSISREKISWSKLLLFLQFALAKEDMLLQRFRDSAQEVAVILACTCTIF